MDKKEENEQVENIYLLSFLSKETKSLEAVKDSLESQAKILKIEELGERELSYPINKQNKLFLSSVFFSTQPSQLATIREVLKENKAIERFLITHYNASLEEKKKKVTTKNEKIKEENV